MATPKRQRVYEPRRLMGQSIEELRREMQEELDNMALTLGELTSMDYLPQAAEPPRFADGSIRYFAPGASVTGKSSTLGGLHQFRNGYWRRLVEQPSDDIPGEGWQNVTFLNGVTNYGLGYATVQFRKLSNGEVLLKGVADNPTSGSNMFQLPVGYRPLATHITIAQSNGGAAELDIEPDGTIAHVSGPAGWISLSGIHFFAEQ